jgi:uncharacterized protein YaaW (UPF0174 family)
MELPIGLTIEQEFSLKIQAEQVKEMNHEQTKECLLAVLRQLAIKENVVKHLMMKQL